jgi:cellulose synthase/poly-beta-1,6-N-acetylglucosamine synthase-like glycosyltransferase
MHTPLTPPEIASGTVSRALLVCNAVMAVVYMAWWCIPGHAGNPVLYALLFLGEIYHVGMALIFWHTIWPRKRPGTDTPASADRGLPRVDVFVTVAGEPLEILAETVRAARDMRYAGHHEVYILNDGRVAKKEHWRDVEVLAHDLGVHCITRSVPGGAKAGNINHALQKTTGEIVVLFDTDMVAHPDFLEKVIPSFQDETIGFVQTPQFYKNADVNRVTRGAWEQQAFFFGPILRGKDTQNAAFVCGTNVAIRRTALLAVGGMCEKNIAEDFLTSLQLHEHGWRSRYVPEVLAEGLAPEDLQSYLKQQLRWARGSLEVLLGFNPLLKRGLSWRQKMQYLSSALYYLHGVVVLIDVVMPLLFLFSGAVPVATTTTSFAFFFIPFLFLNLYTIDRAAHGHMTFRAASFSFASSPVYVTAFLSALLKRTMAFAVTPKRAQVGNVLPLVLPHLLYIVLAVLGTMTALVREGLTPSVTTNVAWAAFDIVLCIPFLRAAAVGRSLRWQLARWGSLLHPLSVRKEE